MNRSDLIDLLAEDYPFMRKADVIRVIDQFFDTIVDTLEAGGRVELRGFGTFSLRAHPARQSRNPKSGEPVAVAAKARLRFRAGLGLARRIDASTVERKR
jgi:integration host factor subunit beta